MVDIHKILSKIPLRNTPLQELHYFDPITRKFDAYTGPFTRLDIRCEPDCSPNNLKPIPNPDYNYNQISEICHKHDELYQESGEDHNKKIEADKILLNELSKINPRNLSEKLQKFLVEKIISMKVKLGLGIREAHDNRDEIYSRIRHKFPRRMVEVYALDDIWCADLMIFEKIDGYSYLLTIMDLWSKYLWAFALRTKSTTDLKKAFEIVLKSNSPKMIWFDKESAMYSKIMTEYLEEKKIKLYSVESELKCSPIERLNRTIRDKVEKIELKWLTEMPNIVLEYNNSIHSTIKMSPINARKHENQLQLTQLYAVKRLIKQYQHSGDSNPFKVGDKVHIYKYKALFTKGSKAKWTNECFYIKEIKPTSPFSFIIEDENNKEIKGAFYRYELLRFK